MVQKYYMRRLISDQEYLLGIQKSRQSKLFPKSMDNMKNFAFNLTNNCFSIIFLDRGSVPPKSLFILSRLSRCSAARGLVLGSPLLVPLRLRLLSLFRSLKVDWY